jgi:hypothetical protein
VLTWKFKSVARVLGRLIVGVEVLTPEGAVHSSQGYYPTAETTFEQLTQAVEIDVAELNRLRAFDALQAQVEARITAGG